MYIYMYMHIHIHTYAYSAKAHSHQFVGSMVLRGARRFLKSVCPRPPGAPPGHACSPRNTRGRPWISTGGSRNFFLPSKKTLNLRLDFLWYFDPQNAPKSLKNRATSIKQTSDFLIDFLSQFGSMLGAFFHHFCFQKYVRIGKGDLMKMSFSCTRGAHFQGFRPPRSI